MEIVDVETTPSVIRCHHRDPTGKVCVLLDPARPLTPGAIRARLGNAQQDSSTVGGEGVILDGSLHGGSRHGFTQAAPVQEEELEPSARRTVGQERQPFPVRRPSGQTVVVGPAGDLLHLAIRRIDHADPADRCALELLELCPGEREEASVGRRGDILRPGDPAERGFVDPPEVSLDLPIQLGVPDVALHAAKHRRQTGAPRDVLAADRTMSAWAPTGL